MPTRPCLGASGRLCGNLTVTGSRCPQCARIVETERTRAKRQRRPYTAAERARRARVVTAHRRQLGDWCPGWRRPPHPAQDLTADHPIPVAVGGAEGQDLTVLCRSCNSRKQAQVTAVTQRETRR